MPDGRKRIAVIAATLIALLASAVAVGLGVAVPSATAKPDLETVKKKVERLDHEAEIASERYNDAKVKLTEAQTRLTALNADLARQRKVVDEIREQVAAMVVDQYQGHVLSTTSQVMLSEDPDQFLDNLNAVSAYNDQRGEVMREYSTQLDRLKLRKKAVASESRRLAKVKRRMAAEKAEIDKKAAAAQKVLDGLEADARARLLRSAASASRSFTGRETTAASTFDAVVPANGRAAAAVKFAMAQVGKAYAYGAAGPNAYDCSGLTMRAWGAAGVSLPHSSSAQMGSGARIPESQLQPGDLVFYYSPVSHVGLYIGNGMIVNALNPRSGVRVSGLHSMPYVGAVRPG